MLLDADKLLFMHYDGYKIHTGDTAKVNDIIVVAVVASHRQNTYLKIVAPQTKREAL